MRQRSVSRTRRPRDPAWKVFNAIKGNLPITMIGAMLISTGPNAGDDRLSEEQFGNALSDLIEGQVLAYRYGKYVKGSQFNNYCQNDGASLLP